MKFKFSVDTEEIDEDYNFDRLLTDAMLQEIKANVRSQILGDRFKEFAQIVSDTIVNDTKKLMQSFLKEEIVLTERWGETSFVGSVEDLLKRRFDDVILRPVDGSGKTVVGCTSKDAQTWIEWKIKWRLEEFIQKDIDKASRDIQQWVTKLVNDKLIKIKDDAIEDQVNGAFLKILKQGQ
ncbi:MAG: hypothetical protein ABIL06_13055 [Pseudomonadota bacterium]|uniref:Uncharacterized protein n=1 Tax=viral metagenome TaxID=1070528 RepID=A0A6H1ZGK3_9ZZZZ